MKKKLSKKIINKAKNWKLGDFFRNFTAVVLGIIITFIGSDLVAEYNTKNEVKRALQLVKNELQDNKGTMIAAQERIILEKKAARFLLHYKDRLIEAPKDSFNLYCSTPFQWAITNYTSDALELLKSSSLFQKINDENLSLLLIKTYGGIESTSLVYTKFYETKSKLSNKTANNPILNALSPTNDQYEITLWNSIFSTPEGHMLVKQIPEIIGSEKPFQENIELIDKAIKKIEDYK